MPITLSPVDLSTYTVNQSGPLSLTNATGQGGVTWGLPGRPGPTLRLHNESGTGLLCTLNNSNQQFYLTAGGWQDCYPRTGDSSLLFTVLYVLPNPPVTLLLGTYYAPGEPVPAITTLGNSPIGIGGSVNVTSVQTLSNDGNLPGTTVIEYTDSSSPSSNGIFDNSGNIKIGVMISGTLYKIFQTIGNPPAGSTEVLLGTGQNNNIVEARSIIQADAGISITSGGIALVTGSISKVKPFGPYTLSTTATFYNHNLGVIPDFIILTCVGTSSTAEMAKYDDTTMTSTQVKLVSNGSFNFRGVAIKF